MKPSEQWAKKVKRKGGGPHDTSKPSLFSLFAWLNIFFIKRTSHPADGRNKPFFEDCTGIRVYTIKILLLPPDHFIATVGFRVST